MGGASLRVSTAARSWPSCSAPPAEAESASAAAKATAASSGPGTRIALGGGSSAASRATIPYPSRRGSARATTTTSGRTTWSRSAACLASQGIDTPRRPHLHVMPVEGLLAPAVLDVDHDQRPPSGFDLPHARARRGRRRHGHHPHWLTRGRRQGWGRRRGWRRRRLPRGSEPLLLRA